MIVRALVTGLVSFCLVAPAFAAEPTPVATSVPVAVTETMPIFTSPQTATRPFHITLPSIHVSTLESAVIGAQAIDAFETGRCMQTGYCYETNHTVRPFSRGGAVEIFGAFLAADLIRNVLLRHAGKGLQNAVLLLQGAMNVQGIAQTTAATRTINAYKGSF